MGKKLTRDQLAGIVEYYRTSVDQMQGRTFYCEDKDGVLRRWYPPSQHLLLTKERD